MAVLRFSGSPTIEMVPGESKTVYVSLYYDATGVFPSPEAVECGYKNLRIGVTSYGNTPVKASGALEVAPGRKGVVSVPVTFSGSFYENSLTVPLRAYLYRPTINEACTKSTYNRCECEQDEVVASAEGSATIVRKGATPTPTPTPTPQLRKCVSGFYGNYHCIPPRSDHPHFQFFVCVSKNPVNPGDTVSLRVRVWDCSAQSCGEADIVAPGVKVHVKLPVDKTITFKAPAKPGKYKVGLENIKYVFPDGTDCAGSPITLDLVVSESCTIDEFVAGMVNAAKKNSKLVGWADSLSPKIDVTETVRKVIPDVTKAVLIIYGSKKSGIKIKGPYTAQPPAFDTKTIVQHWLDGQEWERQHCLKNGLYYWVIYPAKLTLTKSTPGPVPRCIEGTTKCIGNDLYKCVNGNWTLVEKNSSKCRGPTPTPTPQPEQAKGLPLWLMLGIPVLFVAIAGERRR